MTDRPHNRSGEEPTCMQWESYKQQILEQLAAGKFAHVYGHLQDAKPSGDGTKFWRYHEEGGLA